ncbi:MAG: amidophosphoribosyltransferase [Candidatus Bathyarchaeia archaeon]
MRDHCGILGAYLFEDREDRLSQYLYDGLCALQHRGQESVGITVHDGRSMKTLKNLGLVSQAPSLFEGIKGLCGIGHDRYSTTGQSSLENAQPLEMISRGGIRYSIAFNGNISNYFELVEEIRNERSLKTTSDAEVLGYLFGRDLGLKDIATIVSENAPRIQGAYSVVMLIDGKPPKLVAIRDPLGFRPLCLGRNEDGIFIASESVAFEECYMDAKFERDLEPGELLIIEDSESRSVRFQASNRHAHCMFEWVYFARPDSILESIPVYTVRERLGSLLAKDYRPNVDAVIPVPDSGRSAAAGYSMASGIPLKEGFQKDRYMDRRSFIMPDQEKREAMVKKKLNPLPSVVQGKRILLIDDSIVRGTSMRGYVQSLKKRGALEVHLGISCPPLIDWCPYGIDFYEGELIARKFLGKPLEEICRLVAKELGADSLYYNSLENLIEAIGLPKEDLCLGCLTGVYPHKVRVVTREERKR